MSELHGVSGASTFSGLQSACNNSTDLPGAPLKRPAPESHQLVQLSTPFSLACLSYDCPSHFLSFLALTLVLLSNLCFAFQLLPLLISAFSLNLVSASPFQPSFINPLSVAIFYFLSLFSFRFSSTFSSVFLLSAPSPSAPYLPFFQLSRLRSIRPAHLESHSAYLLASPLASSQRFMRDQILLLIAQL